MKFFIGLVIGAGGMFGLWWYTKYVEIKENE